MSQNSCLCFKVWASKVSRAFSESGLGLGKSVSRCKTLEKRRDQGADSSLTHDFMVEERLFLPSFPSSKKGFSFFEESLGQEVTWEC